MRERESRVEIRCQRLDCRTLSGFSPLLHQRQCPSSPSCVHPCRRQRLEPCLLHSRRGERRQEQEGGRESEMEGELTERRGQLIAAHECSNSSSVGSEDSRRDRMLFRESLTRQLVLYFCFTALLVLCCFLRVPPSFHPLFCFDLRKAISCIPPIHESG